MNIFFSQIKQKKHNTSNKYNKQLQVFFTKGVFCCSILVFSIAIFGFSPNLSEAAKDNNYDDKGKNSRSIEQLPVVNLLTDDSGTNNTQPSPEASNQSPEPAQSPSPPASTDALDPNTEQPVPIIPSSTSEPEQTHTPPPVPAPSIKKVTLKQPPQKVAFNFDITAIPATVISETISSWYGPVLSNWLVTDLPSPYVYNPFSTKTTRILNTSALVLGLWGVLLMLKDAPAHKSLPKEKQLLVT
jgi:hypothetical protein